MWRVTEEDGLGLENSLLPLQTTAQRNLHDTYHRQQQSEAQRIDHSARPAHSARSQQNLNAATSQPPELSLGPGLPAQLDLESITLSNVLGINGDHMLARLQRNPNEQITQSPPELSAILAASLGLSFLPVSGMCPVPGRTSVVCTSSSHPVTCQTGSASSCRTADSLRRLSCVICTFHSYATAAREPADQQGSPSSPSLEFSALVIKL